MMRFRSTRGTRAEVTFSVAMEKGLAPDGGLFVPARLPRFAMTDFRDLESGSDETLGAVATRLLTPFFAGDPLAPHLASICRQAFTFPTPLVDTPATAPRSAVLELYHGPTSAFKDVGARFLAGCFAHLPDADADADAAPRTVLVATSGDTGGAVASALDGQPGIEVILLFPHGGVSPEQHHQLTCWGDNVRSFAVRGTFDDCQRVVKQAFADEAWRTERRLTTANSINIARLLPQTAYHAYAALEFVASRDQVPTFIVPSGNVGNATAALWARAMGFPVGRVVMATNRNRAVPDYVDTGDWCPRPSLPTLANAMDVGDPSNMERVFDLLPTIDAVRESVSAVAVDDAEIGAMIEAGPSDWGRVFDPHTAVAAHVLATHPEWAPAVVVATAHPAKFKDVVEPRIGRKVEMPPALSALMSRESRWTEIDPNLAALRQALG